MHVCIGLESDWVVIQIVEDAACGPSRSESRVLALGETSRQCLTASEKTGLGLGSNRIEVVVDVRLIVKSARV